jgi:hypothetical protein
MDAYIPERYDSDEVFIPIEYGQASDLSLFHHPRRFLHALVVENVGNSL